MGIMLSFLPRVWDGMMAKADSTECIHTLGNLGKGFALYAEDHSDFLPHHDAGNKRPPYDQCWYDVIAPYLSVSQAHQHLQEPGMLRLHQLQDGQRGHSYKMNSRLQDYRGRKSYASPPFRHIGTLGHPDQTILIFDGDIENQPLKYFPYGMYSSVENRHSGKASLLMADFSVINSSGGHEERYWQTTGGFVWDGDLSATEQ